MKRLVAVAGLALVAAFLVPKGVLADPPGPRGGGSGYHQRFQQELGLTDDQMQAIREIQGRQRDAARQLWQQLVTAQGQIRQLALSGADDGTIQPKATEIEGIQSQLLQLRVNALREMAPLLSEEQRQKLAQMNPRRGHWRHRGPAQQG